MKKTRKLLPAIAMLLISAVMMSTASFAWFSMNTEVSASGMEVKATTGANLYIANGNVALASVTGTAVDNLGVTATSLSPVNVVASTEKAILQIPKTWTTAPTVSTPGAAATWNKVGEITATTSTPSTIPDSDPAEQYVISQYVASAIVTLARKQTAEGGTYNLKATCTITVPTDNSSELNKSIRAAVVINNRVYISNDNGAADGTLTFDFAENITNLTDNTAYPATLLVWYEGEDQDCTANNAVKVTNNSVVWKFEIVE